MIDCREDPAMLGTAARIRNVAKKPELAGKLKIAMIDVFSSAVFQLQSRGPDDRRGPAICNEGKSSFTSTANII